MAWKKIEPESNFWSPEKEGDEIVGKLLGSRTTQNGDIYDLETEKGKIAVSGWAVLKDKLDKIEEGTNIKIVFKGTYVTQNKRTAFKFDVFVEE